MNLAHGIRSHRKYVVGFLFSKDRERVVLVKKTHPEWQAGKLNGPGGKVEKGETPHDAMVREFEEEIGIRIQFWIDFAQLSGDLRRYDGEPSGKTFTVYFFYAFGNLSEINRMVTDCGEQIMVLRIDNLAYWDNLVSNVKWLVPLALSLPSDRASSYEIEEVY